jgi:hypothetical protein
VLAEAVAAAATLYRVTGEPRYLDLYQRWWVYADRHLVDRVGGSWHHEVDAAGRPTATVWSGKPDVYHAFQATLLPLLPPVPSLASALTSEVVAELDVAAGQAVPLGRDPLGGGRGSSPQSVPARGTLGCVPDSAPGSADG